MNVTQAELTIDLSAIAANWAWVRSQIQASCDCGAVVKADAYGLGVSKVAPALASAGCESFYVSTLEEGLALQQALDGVRGDFRIFVLTGCAYGQEQAFIQNNLIPVLISLEMFYRWRKTCQNSPESTYIRAAIKVDTGMGRLGLSEGELSQLLASEIDFCAVGIKYVFSHLACADIPEHPLNRRQLMRFEKVIQRLLPFIPGLKTSFANSAGVMLGEDFHFDFVRPGIALYGGQPTANKQFSLRTVLSLILPIIQVRQLPAGESVGYGATRSWESPRLIAVAKSGYADGLLRSLSNKGSGVLYVSQHSEGLGSPLAEVPMVGRISMDTILFDVTNAPREVVPGDGIEVLGANKSLEMLAAQANSINHEILTSLSGRYIRKYLWGKK